MEISPNGIWQSIEHLPAVKKLPPQGIAFLQTAITNGPSRKVGAGALFSTSGAIAIGQGRTVEYESEDGEATFVRLCALDRVPLVLSQPPEIFVCGHDRKGRRRNRYQTPDYLRVTATEIALIEVKPLARLERMRTLCPMDWQVKRNVWSFLPGVEAANAIGMKHQIFFPEAYTPQHRANLKYLLAARKEPTEMPSARLVNCIVEALDKGPKTIGQLCLAYLGITADHLIALIDSRQLYGLLEHQTLGLDFVLFGSAEQRDKHLAEIQSFRPKDVLPGSLTHRLNKATQKELDHAKASFDRYRTRRDMRLPMDSRDYRIRNGIKAAVDEGASPIAGLIPHFSERGGAGTPLKDEEIVALRKYLREEYVPEVRSKPSPTEVHNNLVDLWAGTGRHIPCVETIRKYMLKTFTPEQIAGLIGGPRAIQNARRKTPGELCNERLTLAGMWAQCDAVYSDIVPKDIEKSAWSVTRPIVFPLVMSASLYIASAGVQFGKPSALGFLMAIRLCLQEHGWLPACVFNDRGPEFNNNVWADAVSTLQLERARRPIASSRSGGEIEMVNGQLNKYLHTLEGGTYHDQAGRSADQKQKGRATAKHDQAEVVAEIYRWVERWNNTATAVAVLPQNSNLSRNYKRSHRRCATGHWMRSRVTKRVIQSKRRRCLTSEA